MFGIRDGKCDVSTDRMHGTIYVYKIRSAECDAYPRGLAIVYQVHANCAPRTFIERCIIGDVYTILKQVLWGYLIVTEF
eukprot:CCRYP_004467-RA/>CCRYP_004467-RA protein AED:0.45 eAED:0.45 QI:8/1/1/1/0/0/2/43/78